MLLRLIRAFLSVLRRFWPVPRFRGRVLVTRHADVIDVLTRDQDFTIEEINDENMRRITGAFFLGMDCPEYEREAEILRQAVRSEDLTRIAKAVQEDADARIDDVRAEGRIDVVEQYARPVAAGLVGSYLGVPGPDLETLMRWNRAIFHDIFLNFGGKPEIRNPAIAAGEEMNPYLEELIADLSARTKRGEDMPDTFLQRLICADPAPGNCLDPDGVRRNISGVLLGAVETTSKVVAVAIDELIKRPREFAGAKAAANANDLKLVQRYTWEAMRFNPHNPLVIRHAPHDTKIDGHLVWAGDTVYALTLSAMFDPKLFQKPNEFRVDRPLKSYLHFGYGLHRCFGEYVNGIQIPHLMMALLRLPGLRRANGAAGKMKMAGPFPERLVLSFDA